MVIFSERMRYWEEMIEFYQEALDNRLTDVELDLLDQLSIYCFGTADRLMIRTRSQDVFNKTRTAIRLWGVAAIDTRTYPRDQIEEIVGVRIDRNEEVRNRRYLVEIGIPLHLRERYIPALVSLLMLISIYLAQPAT